MGTADSGPGPVEARRAALLARVEQALSMRLEALQAHAPPRLLEAMRYALMAGGKRLRPLLCLAFADAVEHGGPTGRAEDAACALECIHTYSLVHDDLPAMDDDDLRRGRPTTHKVYGEALAILVGDALLTEAFAVLAGRADAVSTHLIAELAVASGAGGMVGGQVLDIAEDRPANEPYLRRLHRLKTGALIRAACRMGVIAAGGTHVQLQAATAYGEAVGLAFQVQDDILDVIGTAEDLGKPTGKDAEKGRPTFPAVLGLGPSHSLAQAEVERALAAIAPLEPAPGLLAALARFAVERRV